MNYYMQINGQQTGPFDESALLANGLTPDTMVWTQGMPAWQKASQVPALNYLFAQSGQPTQPTQPGTPYQPPICHKSAVQPQVGFIEAIKLAFSQYAGFGGRSRRSEYWYFYLFNLIASIVLGFLDGLFGLTIGHINVGVLGGLWNLVVLIPSLALVWRRLHDIGKGGGWFFFGLIPIIGWIMMLVWLCTDSEPGDNRFGPSPKYGE